MQDPDKQVSYLKTADTKPSLLLKGATPHLLGEWQTAPVLWDAVRYAIDMRGEAGQFILTGSAVPTDNATQHTGTGRISRMTMRPMSLFESGESNGTVSLKALFDGDTEIDALSELDIEQIAFAIVRGGWPASVGEPERIAMRHAIDYVEAVINQDVSRVDGIEKSPVRVRALMRSLARNISTLATIRTIHEDIAATVMRLTASRLLDDFNYFGFLFESLCDRNLRVYAEAIDGQVFYYRDSTGLETDAVVCLNDGRWAAIEVKLGSREIEEAAVHLLALRDRVNTEKMREPSFLMILTGTELAYRREDGVFVVPIGCLKD